MNSSAIVTFLIIGTFVWGGLALILVVALRRESVKRRRAAAPAPTPAADGTPGATES